MRTALAPPHPTARPDWCTDVALQNADSFELALVREINRVARGATAAAALTKTILLPNSWPQFTAIVAELCKLGEFPLFREIDDGNLPLGELYCVVSATKGFPNPVPRSHSGKQMFK